MAVELRICADDLVTDDTGVRIFKCADVSGDPDGVSSRPLAPESRCLLMIWICIERSLEWNKVGKKVEE